MGVPKDAEKAREAVAALAASGGNKSAAARSLGLSRPGLQTRLDNAAALRLPGAPPPPSAKSAILKSAEPQVAKPTSALVYASPRSGARRFLLTAAQDDTPIHEGFWRNLAAYAEHASAEIMVGGFTYQKGLFEDHAVATARFDSRVAPFLRPEVVELADRLVWYGRANILPTATDPLSGWETASRRSWAIFPHAKIALKCIAMMPGAPGKQIMTTGVVTKPNYVQRNTGQKAEFHHTIGATIVEVAANGAFFCRQISAHDSGTFQDLDVVVRNGAVTTGNRIEAVTWGDIHREFLDPHVAAGSWGFDLASGRCNRSGSILDSLRPAYQFVHDSFNFTARSHHSKHDPHERVRLWAAGHDSVEGEIRLTAEFLAAIQRPFTQTVHIDSNHNQHLHKWARDPDGFTDPTNARYWCELNVAAMTAAEQGDREFILHEWALRRAHHSGLNGVTFLRAGQSFTICQASGGIECSLHADIGPNGARGSPQGFARVVERVNGAHSHTSAIREAFYQAGTSSLLDMHYNTKGPGNWSNSHIITTPGGKRAIVTMVGDAFRA